MPSGVVSPFHNNPKSTHACRRRRQPLTLCWWWWKVKGRADRSRSASCRDMSQRHRGNTRWWSHWPPGPRGSHLSKGCKPRLEHARVSVPSSPYQTKSPKRLPERLWGQTQYNQGCSVPAAGLVWAKDKYPSIHHPKKHPIHTHPTHPILHPPPPPPPKKK